jgi:hypothetical protein
MGVFGDKLIGRLRSQEQWPHPVDREIWDQIRTWIAFRESDRRYLRQKAGWVDGQREYLVDPLPEKISEAFADLIFGTDPPTITPPSPEDQDLTDEMVESSELPAELRRAEDQCSAEGEVWWRIVADPERFQHPRLEFWSRLDVIPQLSGRQVQAVAFIDCLEPLESDGEETVWRHFEVVDEDDIQNALFEGTSTSIGVEVALSTHPAVADLAPSAPHELPLMPAGRIINKEGRRPAYGRSDYAGIEDFLMNLNEALTIGRENARLTLKRRVVVPDTAVDESGQIPAGQEAIVTPSADIALGMDTVKSSSQFQVLEYSFDAEALIKYQNSQAEQALTRCGITPQFIGMPTNEPQGRAITGTALRLRLMPSTNSGEAHAKPWDSWLPKMLMLMALIEARSTELGGWGYKWKQPALPFGIDRGSSLPEDEIEQAQKNTILISAGAKSIRTAIEEEHPDWDEARVGEEWDKIVEETEKLKGPGTVPKLFGSDSKLPSIAPG